MPIPDAIKNVIELANTQESAEVLLESLKTEKATHQTAIASLNQQIIDQTTVVQNARAALKAAAQAI